VIHLFCSETRQNVSFFCFCFGTGGKRVETCGDRYKDQSLVFFLIYTSVPTAGLAGITKRRRRALSIPVAIQYPIFDHFH